MNKKNRIIKIFNAKYKLIFVDYIEPINKDDFTFGICNSADHTIKIALKGLNKKPLKDEVIKQALLHELVHAILNEDQYLSYSNDEPMVEWIAKCIYHLINQNIICK